MVFSSQNVANCDFFFQSKKVTVSYIRGELYGVTKSSLLQNIRYIKTIILLFPVVQLYVMTKG